jgi:hypothetical protein
MAKRLQQFLSGRRDAFQSQIDRRLTAVMGLMLEGFVQPDGARRLESAEEVDGFIQLLRVHSFDPVDDEIVTLHHDLRQSGFGLILIHLFDVLPLKWVCDSSGARAEIEVESPRFIASDLSRIESERASINDELDEATLATARGADSS